MIIDDIDYIIENIESFPKVIHSALRWMKWSRDLYNSLDGLYPVTDGFVKTKDHKTSTIRLIKEAINNPFEDGVLSLDDISYVDGDCKSFLLKHFDKSYGDKLFVKWEDRYYKMHADGSITSDNLYLFHIVHGTPCSDIFEVCTNEGWLKLNYRGLSILKDGNPTFLINRKFINFNFRLGTMYEPHNFNNLTVWRLRNPNIKCLPIEIIDTVFYTEYYGDAYIFHRENKHCLVL